jgi:nicotinate-nucleotide adenylyltransferase
LKKVGIYSGTFDPVHEGHVAFAREALVQCGLDKVFFLVEPRPRRKQGVKAFTHRVEMVHLAIQDEQQFGVIIADEKRFTAQETLPRLQHRFEGAELYMLMGDDMLDHFDSWPHVELLMQEIHFAIGLRTYDRKTVKQRLELIQEIRATRMQYQLFQASQPKFASTTIRLALKAGEVPRGISPVVLDYIKTNGLYASSNDGS